MFSETRSQQFAAKHAGYWNESVVNIPRNKELDNILIAKTSRKLARRHSTSQIQSPTPILKEIRRLSEPNVISLDSSDSEHSNDSAQQLMSADVGSKMATIKSNVVRTLVSDCDVQDDSFEETMPKSDAVTDETQQAIIAPPSAEVKAVHQLDDGSK